MQATFRVPVEKLAGDRNITLKSRCCTVAGNKVYIKLEAAAQSAPVNVFLCVEEPRYTPVRTKCLTITAELEEGKFVDDGCLEMAFNETGEGGRETSLVGSPDPLLGGPLKCQRKGARIEQEDDDDDSEYEWDDDTVTRKDLVDGALQYEIEDNTVDIEATFWIRKVQRVALGCR